MKKHPLETYMKFISLFLFCAFATSINATECIQNEAQFIGHVTELHIVNVNQGVRDCTFKIAFTHFKSSKSCPIDYDLAVSTELEDYLCSQRYTNGDEISGKLIERNGFIQIKQ